MTLGASYKTKKELKENIGMPLKYVETGIFGQEYKSTGSFPVVGPCPYTKRNWFAQVHMKDDIIVKVM